VRRRAPANTLRAVKVTAHLPPQFFGAVAQQTTVDCNGNKTAINTTTRGATSRARTESNDPAKKGDKADVMLASSGNRFQPGNCNIWAMPALHPASPLPPAQAAP